MAETLKEKTAKGLFWGGVSSGVSQVLNLVFGIFLARMLSQSDYGMVGMLSIFSALAGVFQEGGFISALNRKKDVTHNDYNAVFWTSIIVSFTMYVLLFISAPYIASFYGVPKLSPLARYIFIGFFITSISVAPKAYLFRNMMVRENAIITFSSISASGVLALCMAYNGFAYWGIATQYTLYAAIVTILNFYFSHWRPSFRVDFSPIREMFGFSSKLMITGVFNIINANVFSVVLGKMYTPHVVGDFTQANKWSNLGGSLIGGMLGGVAQPVFAKTNEDKERQKQVLRKLLRFTALISFPSMFGLALVSQEFIVILLTKKWLESANLMQFLCVGGAFAPLSAIFSNLLVSRGHSTTNMWSIIMLCVVQLGVVVIAAPYGIIKMVVASVIINVLWFFVWHYLTRVEVDIHIGEVIKDISPYFLLSATLAMIAYLTSVYIENLYLRFVVKVFVVASLYPFILWRLKSTIFFEMIEFFTHYKQKQR